MNYKVASSNLPQSKIAQTAIGIVFLQFLLLANTGTASSIVVWGSTNIAGKLPPSGEGIRALAGGLNHCLGLKSNGTIVAWGGNTFGSTNIPPGLNEVQSISTCWYHNLALKSNGTVVAWGGGGFGEITIPVGLNSVMGIAAGAHHSVALKRDGTVVTWGTDGQGERNFMPTNLSGVAAVAAGAYHTVALLSNGTIRAWGGQFGQTNAPEGLNGVKAIAAGLFHSVGLLSNGTVVSWGWNIYGQTDVPTGLEGVMAIAAGGNHTAILLSNRTLQIWGAGKTYAEEPEQGQAIVPPSLFDVTVLGAGFYHTLALGRLANPQRLENPYLLGDGRVQLRFRPEASANPLNLSNLVLLHADELAGINTVWVTNAAHFSTNEVGEITTEDMSATNATVRFYRLSSW